MTYQNSAQLLRKYSDMIKEMQHPVVESDEDDESKEEVDEAKEDKKEDKKEEVDEAKEDKKEDTEDDDKE